MGILKVTLLLLLLSVIFLIPHSTYAQDVQPPCTIHGTVHVNGQFVEEGTEINAFVEGDIYSTTVTVVAEGNSTYSLTIAPPAGTEYRVCSPIILTIGNITALETANFVPGFDFVLDLTAIEKQKPCVFHGTVQVDGKPVDEGTVVTAIYGIEDHTAETELAANGTSIYSLVIKPPEGEEYPVGDTVTFVIGEIEAHETGTYEPGGDFTLNLSAESAEKDSLIPTIAFLLILAVAVLLLTPLRQRISRGLLSKYLLWMAIAGLTLTVVWLFSRMEWTYKEFPDDLYIPLRDWIKTAVEWLTDNLDPLFDVIKTVMTNLFVFIKDLLIDWLPWWGVLVIFSLVSLFIGGRKIAALTAIGLFLIAMLGRETTISENFWILAMETLSLMVVAVLISIIVGIPIGILASRSDRFEAVVRPILDLMQTMPSFVYLIPVVILLGLGTPAATIAVFIYSVPPCIRLTNLGIRQVSEEVVEAGRAFGSTPMQLLFKIQIPLAMPTIMAGITQTIMLALAMVVIASLIGAEGFGLAVLRGLEQREVGDAFVAGLSIVILAVILDRIGQHIGQASPDKQPGIFSRLKDFIANKPRHSKQP
jgi:glycine betaine/proline transport system permease protein